LLGQLFEHGQIEHCRIRRILLPDFAGNGQNDFAFGGLQGLHRGCANHQHSGQRQHHATGQQGTHGITPFYERYPIIRQIQLNWYKYLKHKKTTILQGDHLRIRFMIGKNDRNVYFYFSCIF
jgi:hypothetical protein